MRIALLISGEGTTMETIIKATQNDTLKNVNPVLVIASKENASGLIKAKNLGISEKNILVINPKNFKTGEEFGEKIIKECKERNVDFIGQYGWLVKTPENVCETFKERIINQHPGPLDNGRPDFGGAGMYGKRVHEARLEFVRRTNHDFWTEATSHRVTSKFDEGTILKIKRVPIFPGDTAEILQARMLPIEHEIQIEILKDFSEGKEKEFYRDLSLIRKEEENILEESKELAKKMYPNG
ncbi:MAG: Phosphoribosylglycinamide formyltransferase [Candidatus Nomurabacteria bacterium GW2011_GWF2_35_12]|uniref:phosphoribosylglycinamide formyltransferase 1 n=3 Tax=Candidatus Nomuraibacteriota TaxID=1752729 RepID=A0A0G0H2J1_9BACT|nr:MAG: Phosphoribosylglycinamide formyltransferase [Candidatus Nomurabacteria bacterium GW2011_GWF2_35_12]KKP72089.1 MAG: Phosphoribosylglycinamide formyltransferase [Candidatus Nomurabacteria bacterium GW2011_GWB1_35_20]KKP76442.1 MAG: phosphoribosylglycinamide formyltransferase, phosphoribosylglycinamide formyltransferase 1 [Parcubacteria group bacterium GW2011_GWC1_35_21]KKP78137.1 MAG: Phosphoribosylglycinamide formyltransferase [Candidatus Nomurabacteria bacterium GW2011_GWC2_35_35]KKP846